MKIRFFLRGSGWDADSYPFEPWRKVDGNWIKPIEHIRDWIEANCK